MSYAILRIRKLKSLGSIAAAGAHIHRTRPTPNADPARPVEVLHGSKDMQANVKARLPEKIRSNAVLAVEIILTASPQWFSNGGSVESWTDHCMAWLEATYGANCVSVVRHGDELTEHLHCVIVPIAPNGRLSCDHFFGTPEKLRKLQDDYAASMKPLGLSRGIPRTQTKRKHQHVRRFYEQCNAADAQGLVVSKVLEEAYKRQPPKPEHKARGFKR